MRMWMVAPEIMCRKHLLGEHVEIHMIVGALRKHKNLTGYFKPVVLIELESLQLRHNQLVKEMERRGYNHKSPLPDYVYTRSDKVDVNRSLLDLLNRCSQCEERYKNGND